jgi:hypothetical protein
MDGMRDIAHAAIAREERLARLRPHLAAGKSIFDFKGQRLAT